MLDAPGIDSTAWDEDLVAKNRKDEEGELEISSRRMMGPFLFSFSVLLYPTHTTHCLMTEADAEAEDETEEEEKPTKKRTRAAPAEAKAKKGGGRGSALHLPRPTLRLALESEGEDRDGDGTVAKKSKVNADANIMRQLLTRTSAETKQECVYLIRARRGARTKISGI
ncbi:hypothetical protein K438DRAFT_1765452 [Mycena galopus ATCC 62051]|nr:hypothetical protein K438DRAFT_1765452 [Mycena galopus ATCC 62051]